MSDRITWNAILERAKDCAKDAMPEFPKSNTVEAWESFQAELEAIDALDVAYEMPDWDWVIYFSMAMKLCREVPSEVLHDAESQWHDIGIKDNMDDSFGLYEFASQLASIIVTVLIAEEVATAKGELEELVENQLENLESA